MSEFTGLNDNPNKDLEPDSFEEKPKEELNRQFRALNLKQELEEDNVTGKQESRQLPVIDENVDQYDEDTGFTENYEDYTNNETALKFQYEKYGRQIDQLSRDRAYFSENEWNSYMDDKIQAQNDVVKRLYDVRTDMSRKKK